jgi:hypothetical protein
MKNNLHFSMWGIDCEDASCGFNLSDLNTFIEFLQGQRDNLVKRVKKININTLFSKMGFEMPTVKDEQNG